MVCSLLDAHATHVHTFTSDAKNDAYSSVENVWTGPTPLVCVYNSLCSYFLAIAVISLSLWSTHFQRRWFRSGQKPKPNAMCSVQWMFIGKLKSLACACDSLLACWQTNDYIILCFNGKSWNKSVFFFFVVSSSEFLLVHTNRNALRIWDDWLHYWIIKMEAWGYVFVNMQVNYIFPMHSIGVYLKFSSENSMGQSELKIRRNDCRHFSSSVLVSYSGNFFD